MKIREVGANARTAIFIALVESAAFLQGIHLLQYSY
jgi:hypothetical protein